MHVNTLLTLLIQCSIWYIILILASFNLMLAKDRLYFDYILWDIKTLTCQCSKTTELILMKFTGDNEQTHRGLYTNFQSNLKFYKNIEICSFNGYRWFLWSYMHIEKLKELSNLLIFHENELI